MHLSLSTFYTSSQSMRVCHPCNPYDKPCFRPIEFRWPARSLKQMPGENKRRSGRKNRGDFCTNRGLIIATEHWAEIIKKTKDFSPYRFHQGLEIHSVTWQCKRITPLGCKKIFVADVAPGSQPAWGRVGASWGWWGGLQNSLCWGRGTSALVIPCYPCLWVKFQMMH